MKGCVEIFTKLEREERPVEHQIDRLSRIARFAGRVFGVEMSVGRSGDQFEFLDDIGDPVMLDGESVPCATRAQSEDGSIDKVIALNALIAAAVLKLQEIDRLSGIQPGMPEAGPGPHL